MTWVIAVIDKSAREAVLPLTLLFTIALWFFPAEVMGICFVCGALWALILIEYSVVFLAINIYAPLGQRLSSSVEGPFIFFLKKPVLGLVFHSINVIAYWPMIESVKPMPADSVEKFYILSFYLGIQIFLVLLLPALALLILELKKTKTNEIESVVKSSGDFREKYNRIHVLLSQTTRYSDAHTFLYIMIGSWLFLEVFFDLVLFLSWSLGFLRGFVT